MTDVYLLWHDDWECDSLEGIYSTLDGAEGVTHGHAPQWAAFDDHWRCQHVTRTIRNVPISWAFHTLSIPVVDGVAVLPDGREVRTELPFVVVPQMGEPPEYQTEIGPEIACNYRIERRPLS